jgi:hypothetical protein
MCSFLRPELKLFWLFWIVLLHKKHLQIAQFYVDFGGLNKIIKSVRAEILMIK